MPIRLFSGSMSSTYQRLIRDGMTRTGKPSAPGAASKSRVDPSTNGTHNYGAGMDAGDTPECRRSTAWSGLRSHGPPHPWYALQSCSRSLRPRRGFPPASPPSPPRPPGCSRGNSGLELPDAVWSRATSSSPLSDRPAAAAVQSGPMECVPVASGRLRWAGLGVLIRCHLRHRFFGLCAAPFRPVSRCETTFRRDPDPW